LLFRQFSAFDCRNWSDINSKLSKLAAHYVLTSYSWTLRRPSFSGPQPAAVFISCHSHCSGSAPTIFHQLLLFILEYTSTAMSWWGLKLWRWYQPATWYCVNCGLSAGQCRDLFFSRWCRLSSSRGWTTAIRHLPAFHHISCHGCSQWWTPQLGLSFPHQSSSTSLRSFVSCTSRRLQSRLHSNMQSSYTGVYTGPHLHTLLTSFVRWQMSSLVSDSVPVHLYHWLSAAPDSLLSVTKLSRSLLLVSGTVCQILSLPQSAPSVAVF